MVRETCVQSQVESYQRLLKWYLIPTCLTLSDIRYVSRVNWSNPGKRVAPSPTSRCSSYWKWSLLVALDYGRQLYFYFYLIVFKPASLEKRFTIHISPAFLLTRFVVIAEDWVRASSSVSSQTFVDDPTCETICSLVSRCTYFCEIMYIGVGIKRIYAYKSSVFVGIWMCMYT